MKTRVVLYQVDTSFKRNYVMSLKNIRLSQEAKDQLIKLKRTTKIGNWNTLCRWAFCLSMKEPSVPPDINIVTNSNVEMSWETFGGQHAEVYWMMLKKRCHDDGLELDHQTLYQQFKLHLHRGIGYLAAESFTNIFEMLKWAQDQSSDRSTSNA